MSSRNGISSAIYLVLVVAIFTTEVTVISAEHIDFSSDASLLDQRSNGSDPWEQKDNTVRVDPLDNFNKYRGGYDITSKHYWSSTVFTGIYGYAPGILWLLGGIVLGGILLVKKLYLDKNEKSEASKKRSRWSILFAIFLTLLAIVASGVVLGGNARFQSEAKGIVDIIIDTANEASETIYNTTGAMKDIRDNMGGSGGNPEAQGFLSSTSQQLDIQAAQIQWQAKKNRQKIHKGLKIVFIVATLIISVNLVAVIVLSVSGILRLKRTLRLLIILCWFMAVLCWLFFGIYIFLYRFAGDTCTALDNFQRNPYNNSLSSILPCEELLSAKPVLRDVSAGIHNLVNKVNANISLSQPSIPISICNPFSEGPVYLYQPDKCPSTSIRIGDIPNVLKVFTCSSRDDTTCEIRELSISNEEYKNVEAYTSSIQSLVNAYPGMESLVKCQSVKDAFSDILINHCKPLKNSILMVWTSMAFLSLIMVTLVVLWTTRDHHEHCHHFSDGGSVGDHSSAENMMDLGTGKAVQDNPNSLV